MTCHFTDARYLSQEHSLNSVILVLVIDGQNSKRSLLVEANSLQNLKEQKKKKKCLLYYIKEILKNNETILCHRLWKEIDYNFGIEQQLWSQGR